MAATFNISKIFQDIFGYRTPEPFTIENAPERTSTSKLGYPMYAEDVHGREFFLPVRLNDILIPFAVVAISCKKTIESTPLVEREGTVKELINTEDYVINIKGIIVRPDNEWPEDEITELERLFRVNASVPLRSALTDIFLKGSYEHRVVIRDIRFPANAGVQHAKPFEMELESDQIFTLEVD